MVEWSAVNRLVRGSSPRWGANPPILFQPSRLGANKEFLVDAFVFPGNSGGPVVSKPEALAITGTKSQDYAYLIGIVVSLHSNGGRADDTFLLQLQHFIRC